MKRLEVLQQFTILATSPEEWDGKVNKALREVTNESKVKPIVHRAYHDGLLEAVIEYHILVEEPEDARDRLNLKGIRYTCDNCPHLVKSTDRRIKNLECGKGMRIATCRCDEACAWFYEGMERGEE